MSLTSAAQPGPLIVRAWFDTVLNPLIRGLETEAAVLETGNLTWRFEQQRLASVARVKDHLMPEVWPNYDQFIRRYPDCQPPIQEHDRLLEALLECCRDLEKRLVESKPMRELFARAKATLPSDTDLLHYFNVSHLDDCLRVLAEYVINNVQHLPSYYITAPFWNDHKDEFLALRDTDEIRPSWEARVDASTRFGRVVNQLITTLRTLREELSFSVGVPIVERD